MSVQQHNELYNNSETGETVVLMQIYANRYRIYGDKRCFITSVYACICICMNNIYINLYLLIQIEYSIEKKSEIHLCTSRFVGQVLFLGRGERILKNNV